MQIDMPESDESIIVSMQMTFGFKEKVTILFDDWAVDNKGMYALALILILLLTIAFEFVQYLKKNVQRERSDSSDSPNQANGRVKRDVFRHILMNAFLHLVGITFTYVLMLLAMTFNGGIFIVIVLGLTFGNFGFGLLSDYQEKWRMVENNST